MIRKATTADIPRMVELGRLMHDESPRFQKYQYLDDQVGDLIKWLIHDHKGLAIVADVADSGIIGGILAMSAPHFACAMMQACDLSFFMHPQHRGGTSAARLVASYRKWANSIGAEPNMGISTGVQTERTGKLFAALGAKQSGSTWTWGLQHV